MSFFSIKVILWIVVALVYQVHHKCIKLRKMRVYTSTKYTTYHM